MFKINKIKDVEEKPFKTGILIPVFNEEKNIGQVIDECLRFNPSHIVLIDDSSNDTTPEILKNYNYFPEIDVLTNKTNIGKQGSIKKGLEFILKYQDIDSVVMIDGDMQHHPEHIPKICSLLHNHDTVITKRSKKEMPFSRKLANWLVKAIYHSYGIPISDMQTGYRAYNIECSKFISQHLESKGGYNIEHDVMKILAKMAVDKKEQLHIAEYEVPCSYGMTESHIKFKDNLGLAIKTFKTASSLKKYKKQFKKVL